MHFLAELLCGKFHACKHLCLAENDVSKEDLLNLIVCLEGRSYVKASTPFWLSVGEGWDELGGAGGVR